jgi:Zn-dependent protease
LTLRGRRADKGPIAGPSLDAAPGPAKPREGKEAVMLTRLEVGRIAGIPIYLDMMFVLVLLLFTYRYFTSGSVQAMSAGFVIVIGLLLSILLHELGHAFAGRAFKAHVSHIDLTGLGGVAHFERTLPNSVLVRTVIYLAGPAVNLGLWLGFDALARQAAFAGLWMLASPLIVLAWANYILMVFNLLPAYPLDGGHTLDAWLGRLLGPVWSVRIVACLGLAVAAGVAYLAFPREIFLLFIALFLAMSNWQQLQDVGRWQR